MLIHPKFVFIHINKTGGTWIHRVTNEYPLLRTKPIAAHAPLKNLPSKHRNLPVLAFVRNPWDWYVCRFEWHHYVVRKKIAEWGTPPSRWNAAQHEAIELNKTFENSLKSGRSLSAFLEHMLTIEPPMQVHLKRLEDGVAKGLLQFCQEVGIRLPEKTRDAIAAEPPVNVLPGKRPFQEYYTPELYDLVAKQDQQLIETHGYSFS